MQPNQQQPGSPRRQEKRLTPWNEYLMSMYGKEAIVITSDPSVTSDVQIMGTGAIEPVTVEPVSWRGIIKLINLEHPNCVLETSEGVVTLFNVNAILIPKEAR